MANRVVDYIYCITPHVGKLQCVSRSIILSISCKQGGLNITPPPTPSPCEILFTRSSACMSCYATSVRANHCQTSCTTPSCRCGWHKPPINRHKTQHMSLYASKSGNTLTAAFLLQVRLAYLSNERLVWLQQQPQTCLPGDLLLQGALQRLQLQDQPALLGKAAVKPRGSYCSKLHYGLPGGQEHVDLPLHHVWHLLAPRISVKVSGQPCSPPPPSHVVSWQITLCKDQTALIVRSYAVQWLLSRTHTWRQLIAFVCTWLGREACLECQTDG